MAIEISDADERRRRREDDIKNIFPRFIAELGDRNAIEATAKHIDSDPAWAVREEWRDEPGYLLFLAFWFNYRCDLKKRKSE